MRINSIRGWLGRIHEFFRRQEESLFFRYFTKPAVLGIPPVLVTAFYSNKGVEAVARAELPWIASFLSDHSVWAIAFAGLYPGLVVAITVSLTKKIQPKGPNADSLLALFSTIDAVVGAKLNRFADHFIRRADLTKETAFCAITHPEKQIEELVRGVCDFFNAVQPGGRRKLIRVVLAVLEGGEVTAVPIFFPNDEPVRATIAELNDPRSAIRVAASSRKILVLEDIAKELKKPDDKRRFVSLENDDDHYGSIICYPVVFNRTREVPFVLSIHCEEARFFETSQTDMYALCLQRFAIRLCLEYSLLKLKESFDD